MSWESKYWEIVDNLYWSPKFLGLKSLPRKSLIFRDDLVCIPRELVQGGGRLYARNRKDLENAAWLLTQEEILNHIFNITFAIAPDHVLERLFCSPLDIRDPGQFESLGREIHHRYGWERQENVTQQDAFFVCPRTALGVELKLGSSTSPGQLAKYVALLCWEERVLGPRENLGLLFLVPEAKVAKHWQACNLDGPVVTAKYIEEIRAVGGLPARVRHLIETEPDHVADVLTRIKLGVRSWSWLRDEVASMLSTVNADTPGEQTLQRLLIGFLAQLRTHHGTGIAD